MNQQSEFLRRSNRQKRQDISTSDRELHAINLFDNIKKIVNFDKDQKIAIYISHDGEVNPKYLQSYLKEEEINTYLPILDDNILKFAKISDTLRSNKYGIPEPISTDIIGAKQLDILFLPLVVFDDSRSRIGMGGGYYDRALSFKKNPKQSKKPILIGLAFDFQEVDQIHQHEFDISLDIIVTPTTIHQPARTKVQE